MTYTITVLTTTDGSELVAAYLYGLGAEGVAIQDKQDLLDLMEGKSVAFWDYVDDRLLEMDDVAHVTGFFVAAPTEADMATLRDMLAVAEKEMPISMGSLKVITGQSDNDENWYENWKAFYHPIAVGNVTVLPSWCDVPEGIVVRIDPCMAFGTGEHETTQMCLDLLQTLDAKEKQIIDVGCGSGILGIAALKLGAKHAYFADLDPDAMRNMRENAALNGVQHFEARTASLLEGCEYVADIMMANITADILMLLAPSVPSHLDEGGQLILSGIIAERAEEVLDVYRELGYKVRDSRAMGDWRAYRLTK